jgi:cell pole-organizing protein PopZ
MSHKPDDMSIDEILDSIKKFVSLEESKESKDFKESKNSGKDHPVTIQDLENQDLQELTDSTSSSPLNVVQLSPVVLNPEEPEEEPKPQLSDLSVPEFMKQASLRSKLSKLSEDERSPQMEDKIEDKYERKQNNEKIPSITKNSNSNQYQRKENTETPPNNLRGSQLYSKFAPQEKSSLRDSLQLLTETVRFLAQKQPPPSPPKEPRRSLDSLVENLIQQAVCEWLELHLPTLFEECVREELTKIIQRLLNDGQK